MRSAAGEKVGQLPGPRSFVTSRPPAMLIFLIRVWGKSFRGWASKMICLPSCDHDGEPHWSSPGDGSAATSVVFLVERSSRYRLIRFFEAAGLGGFRLSSSISEIAALSHSLPCRRCRPG